MCTFAHVSTVEKERYVALLTAPQLRDNTYEERQKSFLSLSTIGKSGVAKIDTRLEPVWRYWTCTDFGEIPTSVELPYPVIEFECVIYRSGLAR